MPFRPTPTIIKNAEDDLKGINDNFEQLYQDTKELSGILSNTASVSFSVTSGSTQSIEVSLLATSFESRQVYFKNQTDIKLIWNAYIDTEDEEHLWPTGDSLTNEQENSVITFHQALSVVEEETNEIATYVGFVKNFGASTHSYTINLRVFAYPSPDQGRFRSVS